MMTWLCSALLVSIPVVLAAAVSSPFVFIIDHRHRPRCVCVPIISASTFLFCSFSVPLVAVGVLFFLFPTQRRHTVTASASVALTGFSSPSPCLCCAVLCCTVLYRAVPCCMDRICFHACTCIHIPSRLVVMALVDAFESPPESIHALCRRALCCDLYVLLFDRVKADQECIVQM